MPFTTRPFSGAADLAAMAALAHAFPADHVHVTDLPYRLSSWALDDPANTQLWLDDYGAVRAWAIMQTPFWTLDYACHPDDCATLHPAVLAWGDARARATVGTPAGHPAWFVAAFADLAAQGRDLEAAGFASQASVPEDPWSQVLMRYTPTAPPEMPVLLSGFSVRPFAGAAEVEAYAAVHRAAFKSESMTPAWRARTLGQPEYRAALDLVAVAPDGRLAAFCVGWLGHDMHGTRIGQIEPLGVHPDFRRLGLGRAVLSACIRRLHENGATAVFLETDNYRDAALQLYEAVGFRVAREIWMYRKDYPSAA